MRGLLWVEIGVVHELCILIRFLEGGGEQGCRVHR